jgi:hypothetical protein
MLCKPMACERARRDRGWRRCRGIERLIEENGAEQGVFLFEHHASRHRRSLVLTSIGEGREATASRLM